VAQRPLPSMMMAIWRGMAVFSAMWVLLYHERWGGGYFMTVFAGPPMAGEAIYVNNPSLQKMEVQEGFDRLGECWRRSLTIRNRRGDRMVARVM